MGHSMQISTAVNMISLIYVKIAELLVTIDVSIHVNFVHLVVNFELAVRQISGILGRAEVVAL
jgi:hypothetical protein